MINHLLPSILARYPKLTEEQKIKLVQILQDVNKSNGGTGAFTLLGGLAIGAIVAATSTATLGLASGAGLIWLAVSNGLNYGHGMEFAREHGCIAHLLNDKQLRKWQDIIGHKAVLTEIQQAYQEGIDVTGDCRSFARQSGQTLSRTKLFDVPKDKSDGASKGEKDQDKNQKADNKGDTAIEKVTKDVVTAFLEDLRCTVLCAPPRTGKGVVAAGMMIGFKAMFPAGKLFSCTIKQFKGEDWYFEPSDYHINPDRRNPIALANSLYLLYRAWESSNSNPESPSLFVLDEIRDTLLAVANVETADVDPELAETHPKFADWLRGELISAATLNQCHRRYVLLISPVSTAQAMQFKDANSLNSYASFTLVTPSELAFSEGNNGTFAAPAIRPDSSLFENWYGLAWGKKAKAWVGVPKIDVEVIKLRESNPPKLNYFIPPVPEVSGNLLTPIGTPALSGQSVFEKPVDTIVSHASTATKAKTKGGELPEPQTDEERWDAELDELYYDCCQKLRDTPNKSVTISNLVKNEKARKRHGATLIGRLSNNANIKYESAKRGNVTSHMFTWLEESGDSEDDLNDDFDID